MLNAVVSGGSRGIGRAIVERLARDGFRVHFLYRCRDDAAGEVAAGVAAAGGVALPHRCDITDRETIDGFLASISGEPVYAVVNNAAVVRDGHFVLMNEERWKVVLDTVLGGAYRLTRGCVRAMLHAGTGRIVNIGSLSGTLGKAGQANYSAAKGGLVAFTKALAQELGGHGITANAVVPGWIETDIVAALAPRRRERALAEIPLARFGRPAEVAEVVSFLLSPRAAYITGTTIRVDGGVGA